MRSRVFGSIVAAAMLATVLLPAAVSAQTTPTCNGVEATLVGTEGNDILIGTDGVDVIVGLGGNDILRGLGGNDIMCGDNGRDRLFGGRGHDTLLGGKKNDILKGDAGRDTLLGNQGNDRLFGGGGADRLEGGSGLGDKMFGKGGFDECLDPQQGPSIFETCEDFRDQILDRSSFGVSILTTSNQIALDTSLNDPLVAFLFAIERGYSFAQVTAAAASGSLDNNGLISGGAVSPEHDRAGVIDLPDLNFATRALATNSHTTVVIGLRERVEESEEFDPQGDANRVLISMILSLYRSGYDLEQITDALILGIGNPDTINLSDCSAIFDDKGRVIRPVIAIDAGCSGSLDEMADIRGVAPKPVSGPLEWVGTFTKDSEFVTQHGPGEFRMTREAGTDDFTLHAVAATIGSTTFFEIGECTLIIERSFDGTGTFGDAAGSYIDFEGELFTDWQYPDCSGITENDSRLMISVRVRIGDSLLFGFYQGHDFSIPGPVPSPT